MISKAPDADAGPTVRRGPADGWRCACGGQGSRVPAPAVKLPSGSSYAALRPIGDRRSGPGLRFPRKLGLARTLSAESRCYLGSKCNG